MVSPDGRWLAGLSSDSGQIEFLSLVSGRRMAAASVWVRGTRPGAPLRLIESSSAAWPTWSRDSRQLIFIEYAQDGMCSVVRYDLRDETMRHLSVGFGHMMMPAMSPSGERVALSTHAGAPLSARIYIVDLQTGAVQQGPQPPEGAGQYWPHWIDDSRIVYLTYDESTVAVTLWPLNDQDSSDVGRIALSGDWDLESLQLMVGLPRPLNRVCSHFACFDEAADRIVLFDLRTGERTPLSPSSRAGCWATAGVFVEATEATEEQISLVGVDSGARFEVLEEACLPCWVNQAGDTFLLLCPDEHPDKLVLKRARRTGWPW